MLLWRVNHVAWQYVVRSLESMHSVVRVHMRDMVVVVVMVQVVPCRYSLAAEHIVLCHVVLHMVVSHHTVAVVVDVPQDAWVGVVVLCVTYVVAVAVACVVVVVAVHMVHMVAVVLVS